MNSTNSKPLLLRLPRPQYVPLPEAFISALAWRLFDPSIIGTGPIGLRFKSTSSGSAKFQYRATAPTGAAVASFGAALEAAGIVGEANDALLADAVVNSVEGVKTLKGAQAVSPLTPGLALLQNLRGLQGSMNPPDLGEILERLFALGAGTDDMPLSASQLWLSAAEHRMKIDPLSSAIDRAVDGQLLDGPRQRKMGRSGARESYEHAALEGTPFEWFRKSWIAVTSEAWVEALPARVWVDWATTVLRLGFGLGYLWESAWYEALARRILATDGGEDSWDSVRSSMDDVMPWRSARTGRQTRDVAPLLRWRSFRADQIRHILEDWADKNPLAEKSFPASCDAMRRDGDLVEKLEKCLRSTATPKSGTNLWEASRYALMTRMLSGPNADYYGLLKSNGRYLTPEPGTEWVAVVASLACGSPTRTVNVSRVLDDLGSMGVRPELADLVSLLERAGLARGSADADQGVLVQSAF